MGSIKGFLKKFHLTLLDIGTGFPYLLASQYFLAGIGAVLGVLTSAFSTTLLREAASSVGGGGFGGQDDFEDGISSGGTQHHRSQIHGNEFLSTSTARIVTNAEMI